MDKEEEPESQATQIEYSDLTKDLFKQAYLDFYYFVMNNKDQIEWFIKIIDESCYLLL